MTNAGRTVYPADHEDGCETPYCCGFHAWSGRADFHAQDCNRGVLRFPKEAAAS